MIINEYLPVVSKKLLKTVTIGIATTIDIKRELKYQMFIFLIPIFYITLITNFKKLPLFPGEVNINLIINLRERLVKLILKTFIKTIFYLNFLIFR